MRSVIVIERSGANAVPIADAKLHCRVDTDEEDLSIDLMIDAAHDHLCRQYDLSILPQTLELRVDGFGCEPIDLARPPVVAVESVKYDDADGAEQTLATSAYRVLDLTDGRKSIALPSGGSWPVVRDHGASVRIRYTAGYQTTVPPELRMTMLFLVAHWYRNREAVAIGEVSAEVEMTVSRLMSPFKQWSV